jgi:hypothetical protein
MTGAKGLVRAAVAALAQEQSRCEQWWPRLLLVHRGSPTFHRCLPLLS